MAFLAKFFGEGDADSRYNTCGAAELGFTRPEFAEMLDDVIRRSFPQGCSSPEREQFLQGLRLEDLMLARACARGIERAWDRFLVLYREKMYRAAGAITGEESTARELADSVYADLFGMRVEGGRRHSKLDSYLGRGSLKGWLRTVLAQEYVNRYRKERRLVSFEDVIEIPARGGTRDVSSSERAQVEKATDAALAALPSEDQFLLAAHYLDGRTLAEIGQMLRVHESTVSRRLEKITSGLRKSIVKGLCGSGMSKRAAEEILEVDVRDIGVDVRNHLTQERRGESFPR